MKLIKPRGLNQGFTIYINFNCFSMLTLRFPMVVLALGSRWYIVYRCPPIPSAIGQSPPSTWLITHPSVTDQCSVFVSCLGTPPSSILCNRLGQQCPFVHTVLSRFVAHAPLIEHALLVEYRCTKVNRNINNIGASAFSIKSQNVGVFFTIGACTKKRDYRVQQLLIYWPLDRCT